MTTSTKDCDDVLLLQYCELVLKIRDLHASQPGNRHYRYLYNQSFYGFTGFLSPQISTSVSERAHERYEMIRRLPSGKDLPTDMREVPWDLQPKFDKGRKVFHLEHVYTGDMFRTAAREIRDVQGLVRLVRDNYRVAWILKTEDQELNRNGFRSERGSSLKEALDAYSKSGIRLLGAPGAAVSPDRRSAQ